MIRIATRGSLLALWQANWTKGQREGAGQTVERVVLKTRGDLILDRALSEIGGKGLFVKEIEEALLDGRADIAVHSLKDFPGLLPAGLPIACLPAREGPRDVLVAPVQGGLEALPSGARVGTSSLRRMASLKAIRPDLDIVS